MIVAPGFIATNARHHAQESAPDTSSSLWGDWLAALQAATRTILAKAVPAEDYAKQLVGVALQKKVPRYGEHGHCLSVPYCYIFMPIYMALLIYNI